jgi:hypothetical protein
VVPVRVRRRAGGAVVVVMVVVPLVVGPVVVVMVVVAVHVRRRVDVHVVGAALCECVWCMEEKGGMNRLPLQHRRAANQPIRSPTNNHRQAVSQSGKQAGRRRTSDPSGSSRMMKRPFFSAAAPLVLGPESVRSDTVLRSAVVGSRWGGPCGTVDDEEDEEVESGAVCACACACAWW